MSNTESLKHFLAREFRPSVISGDLWHRDLIEKSRKYGLLVDAKFSRRVSQLYCNAHFYGLPFSKLGISMLRFLFSWFWINLQLIQSLFKSSKINGDFIIWDSVFEKHFSNKQIEKFFEDGQVVNTKHGLSVFCRTLNNEQNLENVFFKKRPLLQAVQHLNLSVKNVLFLNWKIMKSSFLFTRMAWNHPPLRAAWKDFLTEPLIDFYYARGMKGLYRTNSDFSSQEYWAQKIPFHSVWYSTNSRSVQFLNIPELAEHPLYYFAYFGTNWVWTKEHASWLEHTFQATQNRVVGPILFYTSQDGANIRERSPGNLLVFDVTPFDTEVIRRRVYQKGFNYYHELVCLAFLDDIMKVAAEKNFRVCLKPKRAYGSDHSDKYISKLNEMSSAGGLVLLSERSNIFKEIARASGVISIPFTSPYEIAKSMDCPAIYYDPTGLIDFERMGLRLGDVASSMAELSAFVDKLA